MCDFKRVDFRLLLIRFLNILNDTAEISTTVKLL